MTRHRCNAISPRETPNDDRAPTPLAARRRPGLGAAIIWALAIAGIAPSTKAESTATGLFGSQEFHSDNLAKFPKWRNTLQRFEHELASCTPEDCAMQEWRDLLSSLSGHDVTTQLRLVNHAVNRQQYVEDSANWQRADYWATPLQFFERSGDCEDFAVAKFLALRALGVPSRDLRIVVLHDRRRDMMHAVLAVYVEGEAYILDNLTDAVVAADDIHSYKPIYSINEQGWWLHRS